MNTSLTTRKGLLTVLVFATLGAMSASVFAESTEFRRGYEQGFQDGRQGNNQQYGQGQGQGSNRRISIDRARYGVGRSTCNATNALQNAVDRSRSSSRYSNSRTRQRTFSITASNQLCGDPAPNQNKQLDVSYRCGDGESNRVRASEGNSLQLTC